MLLVLLQFITRSIILSRLYGPRYWHSLSIILTFSTSFRSVRHVSTKHAVLSVLGTNVLSELRTYCTYVWVLGVYELPASSIHNPILRSVLDPLLWAMSTSILASYIYELSISLWSVLHLGFEWNIFRSWFEDLDPFWDSGWQLLMYNNLVPSSGPKECYKVLMWRI